MVKSFKDICYYFRGFDEPNRKRVHPGPGIRSKYPPKAGCPGRVGLFIILLLIVATPAAAIQGMETEEDISNLLATSKVSDEAEDKAKARQWAVLPEFGYGPDTGIMGGMKFSHRNVLGTGTYLDINSSLSPKTHQSFSFSMGSDRLAKNRLLLLLNAGYTLDPERKFFGLGNNHVGPDPASIHEIQNATAAITVGWRHYERICFNFEIGTRDVQIWCNKDVDFPLCTKKLFPDLPGIKGGLVNYLAFSFVWNNRDSVVRPTQGWRVILKFIHTNKLFFTDYEFTHFIGDVGHLWSVFDKRLIFGVRVNGQWITGPKKHIPFWELAVLGGDDTLRGFYPERFLGKGSLLFNGEIRGRLVQFDFFHLWHVQIDGVLFGDGGRVFIDTNDLENEFSINEEIISRIVDDFQYSYGLGLRIALSQSLVARIDAGFSREETGLVYLSFNQTF